MLVIDSESQQALQQGERRESEQERRMRLLAHDLQSNQITVAPDDGTDVSNLLAQMGRPMTAEAIQKKLKLCNPRLHFIRSPQFPELTGVYLVTDEVEIDVGRKGLQKKLKHICGMESGVSPEFSVLHKTKKKIANKDFISSHSPTKKVEMAPWTEVETFASETRGWRTILIRLLHAGLIRMIDVETHFGMPSRNSEKWYKATHEWRF